MRKSFYLNDKLKLSHLVRDFKIDARNNITMQPLLASVHYTMPHLRYGCSVLVKNNQAYKLFLILISIQFPIQARSVLEPQSAAIV